jgi:uncharacterized protein (DUF2236 family)
VHWAGTLPAWDEPRQLSVQRAQAGAMVAPWVSRFRRAPGRALLGNTLQQALLLAPSAVRDILQLPWAQAAATLAAPVRTAHRLVFRQFREAAQQGGGHQPLACRLQANVQLARRAGMGSHLASLYQRVPVLARLERTLEPVLLHV